VLHKIIRLVKQVEKSGLLHPPARPKKKEKKETRGRGKEALERQDTPVTQGS